MAGIFPFLVDRLCFYLRGRYTLAHSSLLFADFLSRAITFILQSPCLEHQEV